MSLQNPLFIKKNDPFNCIHCHFSVPQAEKTCRDHCPKCLYSIHVDQNPGDRLEQCRGKLKPIAWSQHKKKGYVIHYQCLNCKIKKINKFLQNDFFCSDDIDTLLTLSNVTKAK
jgi:hypothetical protein